MRKLVFRDDFSPPLVRAERYADVATGSRLIVEAGTAAYILKNGKVAGPYLPGSYSIQTEISRFSGVGYGGDKGLSFLVFRINTEAEQYIQTGTGELKYTPKLIDIELTAYARITLCVGVADPSLFLKKAIGYNPYDTEDRVRNVCNRLAIPVIRQHLETMLEEKGRRGVRLADAAACAARELRPVFKSFGMELSDVVIDELSDCENDNFLRYMELQSKMAERDALYRGDMDKYLYGKVIDKVEKVTLSDLSSLNGLLYGNSGKDRWGEY